MLRLAFSSYNLQFAKPAATSRGALNQRSILLLRAWDTQDPTIVGWGECGPLPGLSRDDIPDFADEAAAICGAINAGYTPTQADLAHLPSFAFGLDTALRDLALGGSRVLWDTAFARGESGLPTHGLIWMDSPEGLLRQIEGKIAAGFTVIKMKVGALPLARELELLALIRGSYSPEQIELRLDANGAFAADTALGMLEQFARFDVAFLEQPIAAGQWRLIGELCQLSPIPIALDEELIPVADAETRGALLDAIRPQHLIVKPALLGGFTAAEAWIADAEARGIQWWTNSLLESNIGLSAICQWTAALTERHGSERIHGLGTGGLFTNNFPSPIRLAGSRLFYDKDLAWNLPSPPRA
ncbi:MAG: o-succinylbenzoate synthase [Caldilineaceae bacterium]